MKFRMINEDMTVYHDDKTGIDYVSYDGKTLIPLTKGDFNDTILLNNKRNYNADELNKAYSEREKDIRPESDDDYQKRLDAAKRLMKNDVAKDQLDKETRKYAGKEKVVKPKSADTTFFSNYKSNRGDMQKFQMDLKKVIGSQVYDYSEDSYSSFNPTYDGTEFVMPGEKRSEIRNKPVINVYYDYSASWSQSDIALGNKAMSCIDSYRKANLIEYNLFYFSNEVTDYVPHQGGTDGNKVLEHIKKTQPTNVIVMTDSDYYVGYGGAKEQHVTVPGAVFFLWKNGLESEGFQKQLKGKKATWGYDLH